jgi:rubrerythrin
VTEKDLFGGDAVIEFQSKTDRRNFLRYAGLVGVGSGLALAGVACADEESDAPTATNTNSPDGQETTPEEDTASVPQGDLEILNYALTLEYLEAAFYKLGLEAGLVKGRQLELIRPIEEHESAHVAAITETINSLGGQPVAEPEFKIPPKVLNDPAAFLMTAHTFEELGVTAYHGQVTMIETPDILAAAAAIAGVESRHAAILAKMIGVPAFPAPVEATKTMQQVLEAAGPFIKS